LSREDLPTPETRLSVRAHVLLLSGAFFLIFMGAGAQQAFLVPYLAEFTDWGGVQRALVIAAVYFSMMVCRLGNVYLLRRWPQWLFTVAGSLMYAGFTGAMLVTYFVRSYPLAVLAAVVWGWGGAAMWMGTTMQVLALTDRARRYGTGMGVLYAATHAGWLAGVIVLGVVWEAVQGTRPYLLYAAALGFAAVGSGLLWLLPRPREPLPEMPTWAGLVAILRRAKARIAAFLLFSAALSFGLILGTFTDYVGEKHGAQWLWIATLFYPLAQLVLSLTAGVLSERVSHGSLLAVGFFGGGVGMLLPLLTERAIGLAGTALLLGLLNGTVLVVSTAMLGASAERARRPLAYGAMFSWRDLGVVVAVVVGKLLGVQTDNVMPVFEVFAAVFLGCGVVSLILNRYAQERL
jgi:hypothetical protein